MHSSNWFRELTLVVCVGFGLTSGNLAYPQSVESFPSKPLKMVIPFPPGGGTDIIGRAVAAKLQEVWGQPVVVDNQAGANGTIGLTMGMKAAPDGYTITFISTATSINPHIYPSLRYDLLRDFTPVTQLTTQPYVLVVHPSLPVRNMKELIALAKAKPGTLNYGSSGIGGTSHLAGVMLEALGGIKLTHVPYKGGNPAMQDVLAGNIQMLFSSILQSQTFIKEGRLKPLAVTSLKRAPAMPDLPTIAESGVAGVEVAGWFGLALPAKTPRAIVNMWSRESSRIMQSPDMMSKLNADGSQAVGNSPEEFASLIQSETVKWGKIVKDAKISVE